MKKIHTAVRHAKWISEILLMTSFFLLFGYPPVDARGASGNPDQSFGTGTGVADIEQDATDVVQSDGKIIVLGLKSDVGHSWLYMSRHESSGVLDPSFGTNGTVTNDTDGFSLRPVAVALQNDGKILVAASKELITTNYYSFMVLRYNSNGTLDTTFDGDGYVITSFPGSARVNDFKL